MNRTPAILVLADGTSYPGTAFGASGESIGEVVFNTSMSGYQEILTDPSYRGQLVTMTAPHIGNYGVNPLDVESDRVQCAGFIVREASRIASNYRATGTLQEYLVDNGIVGITGIDTRALTRHIRDEGAIMGAIVHGAGVDQVDEIVARIKAAPDYGTLDFVSSVSTSEPVRVRLEPTGDRYKSNAVFLEPDAGEWPAESRALPLAVVLDFGVKYSILRQLAEAGFRVVVVPHGSSVDSILARQPAGVLLSNGPGNPGVMDEAVGRIEELLGKVPIFGICLGHQLLGRAIGGSTFKLKYGHRGPNQPVMEKHSGRVQITSQNHGYAVTLDNARVPVEVGYVNLNDGTIEGLEIPSMNAFSVQHHPEAGPGPHDAAVMFARFREAVGVSAMG